MRITGQPVSDGLVEVLMGGKSVGVLPVLRAPPAPRVNICTPSEPRET